MGILVFILVIIIILFAIYVNSNIPRITDYEKKNYEKNNFAIEESQLNDDLQSSLGIDYRKLRNLLASGSFQEANLETMGIFGQFITGKYNYYGILEDNSSQISRIPSKDLVTLNDLWFKYSNGLYAFSVQHVIFQEIYEQYEAQIIDENAIEKFDMTDRELKRKTMSNTWISFQKEVGWRDSDLSDLNRFNRKGNLPDVFGRVKSIGSLQSMISLFNRIKKVAFDDA